MSKSKKIEFLEYLFQRLDGGRLTKAIGTMSLHGDMGASARLSNFSTSVDPQKLRGE